MFGTTFEFLDLYDGVYRWHLGLNMIALRLISFNMDYYWACKSKEKNEGGVTLTSKLPFTDVLQGESDIETELKRRSQEPLALQHYHIIFFISYIFYVPLHIAGPTMTYNSFVSQVFPSLPPFQLATQLPILSTNSDR